MTDALPDFRRMPVPEALAWLAEHGEPADPRTDIDTASLVRRFPHLAHVEMVDEQIDGPHGSKVAVRWYRDSSVLESGRGLVWIHGGAFIGGHLDMPESHWVALELAARGVPVLAVDYDKCLSGAHFPVPNDDVSVAWAWAQERSRGQLGVEPDHLLLGGASAGSTLAASVVVGLVEAGQPVPFALLLVYPLLHPNGPEASATVNEASPLGQLTLNYAGAAEVLTNPRAFPGLGSGAGFPETLIVVCEDDDLRPSGEAFSETRDSAGVPATLYLERDASHGHIDHPGDAGALRTIDAIASWITR